MMAPFCVSQTVAAGPWSATVLRRRADVVAWLQDDQTHRLGRLLVQEQRQVVERNERMQLLGENVEQLGHRPVAGKGLRDRSSAS